MSPSTLRTQEKARDPETVARMIYETWSEVPGYVPWIERGNSHKQEDARRIARAIISLQPDTLALIEALEGAERALATVAEWAGEMDADAAKRGVRAWKAERAAPRDIQAVADNTLTQIRKLTHDETARCDVGINVEVEAELEAALKLLEDASKTLIEESVRADRAESALRREGHAYEDSLAREDEWAEASDIITEVADNTNAALLARATRVEAELEAARKWREQFDCCMCGDPMGAHSIGSGHSPVSMYDYQLDQAEERALKAEADLKERCDRLDVEKLARVIYGKTGNAGMTEGMAKSIAAELAQAIRSFILSDEPAEERCAPKVEE